MEQQPELNIKEYKVNERDALLTSSQVQTSLGLSSNLTSKEVRVPYLFGYVVVFIIYTLLCLLVSGATAKQMTNCMFVLGVFFGLAFVFNGCLDDWKDYKNAGSLKKWLDLECVDLREPKKKLGFMERILEKHKKVKELM